MEKGFPPLHRECYYCRQAGGIIQENIVKTISARSLSRAILASFIGLLTLLSSPTFGNPISLFRIFYNTDCLSTGVGGLHNYGYGTIPLTNLTGTVTRAYLYWHGPMIREASNELANASVLLNGIPVTGVNIGLGSDNCWGSGPTPYFQSRAYRADVTSIVATNGNGFYFLTNFLKPIGTNSKAINANGASLIVFYDDGDPGNNKDVALLDGNDSNTPSPFPNSSPGYDDVGWAFKLANFTYTTGAVSLELHVSDGQYFAPLDDGPLTFNNTAILAAQGHIFSGSIASANNGPTGNGALWDIKSWRVDSYLTNGQSSLSVSNKYVLADCTSLILASVILPVGAADPPLVLGSLQMEPSGRAFTFTGIAGRTYSVLGSTNLVDWEMLGTPTQLSSNLFQFTEQGPLQEQRFYKLMAP